MRTSVRRSRRRRIAAVLAILVAISSLAPSSPATADGTETLGPASIPIAEGTGIVVAGTGLFIQPSSFDVVVPADATVEQVILYWESGHRAGDRSGEFSDATIRVNGIEVTAPHAGGPSVFFTRGGVDVITSTHRIDITDLGVVGPGTSTLTIDGLDSDEIDDGAGVVVIYSQGGVVNDLQVFDGNDIAFAGFDPPRDTTVPQTYTFAPESRDRTAEIGLMATSTHTTDTPESPPRPSALVYTVGGVTNRINDPFPDTEGREFDSLVIPIVVPAGATELTVQILSDDNGTEFLPASLVWIVGTLSLEVEQFGSLVVRKAVDANVDPAASFDIAVDCDDDRFDQMVSLVDGAEAVIADVPIGTTCTVSEVVPAGFEPAVYSPSDTVTIDEPNTGVTITVTNSLQPGSLVVRKAVDAAVDPAALFEIGVECDNGFVQRLTLVGGAEAVIADVPIGTTCTVSEVVPAGFEPPRYSPSDTVTIDEPNTGVTITVTNALQPGDLRVVKRIGGDTSAYQLGSSFDATVDCDDDAFDQVLTIMPTLPGQPGNDGVITDIPIGTTCTVVETRVAVSASGAPYTTPVYSVTVGSGAATPLIAGNAVTIESRAVGEVVVTITNTPELPRTGAGAGLQLWLAALLVLTGSALYAVPRRHVRVCDRRSN